MAVPQRADAGFHSQGQRRPLRATPAGSSARYYYTRRRATMYRQFHQFFAQVKHPVLPL
ncbi:MAG TPA: hypothetical protein VKV40_18840 [Ktedonobacteraceae bacterium]|nr:hypothetical protein [Ktedonobacteraceae bacterium]